MTIGISKTFDQAIRNFLVEAHVYKEDLEALLEQRDENGSLEDAEKRAETLEEAIQLVEEAIDAVEALPE